jgi:hypothetical protein
MRGCHPRSAAGLNRKAVVRVWAPRTIAASAGGLPDNRCAVSGSGVWGSCPVPALRFASAGMTRRVAPAVGRRRGGGRTACHPRSAAGAIGDGRGPVPAPSGQPAGLSRKAVRRSRPGPTIFASAGMTRRVAPAVGRRRGGGRTACHPRSAAGAIRDGRGPVPAPSGQPAGLSRKAVRRTRPGPTIFASAGMTRRVAPAVGRRRGGGRTACHPRSAAGAIGDGREPVPAPSGQPAGLSRKTVGRARLVPAIVASAGMTRRA